MHFFHFFLQLVVISYQLHKLKTAAFQPVRQILLVHQVLQLLVYGNFSVGQIMFHKGQFGRRQDENTIGALWQSTLVLV